MTRRILYVTHRVPWPPDRGDRIRTWNVLKFLAARAEVDLACLADETASEETMLELRKVTRQLVVIPHASRSRYVRGAISMLRGRTVTEGLFDSPMLASVLQEWSCSTTWDTVMASSSGIARYLFPPFVRTDGNRCVDLIDVDSQKWLDYSNASRFPLSWIYRTEGRRLRNVERHLAQTCDQLFVVSDAERDLFRRFCLTDRVATVSNGVDYQYFAPQPNTKCEPHSCVFVGVMNYRPNVDAVIWFAQNVWPQVRQRYPQSQFYVVGKSPTREVQSLESIAGIQVPGPVPDVRPWLHRSTCAVVPLQIARGVQNKVLEAMACGRPVICSPEPLKGLAAESGTHLLKATAPDEWVSAISRLFDDRQLQAQLGTAAADWVQRQHSWDAALAGLAEL